MKSFLVLALSLVTFSISAPALASYISVGDRVIDGDSPNNMDALVGKVLAIIDSEHASVFFDGYGAGQVDINMLHKAHRCIENVCVGDTFVMKDPKEPFFDTKVRVVEIFENYAVKVETIAFVNSNGENPVPPIVNFYNLFDLDPKIHCEIDALPPEHSCSLRD